MHKHFVLNRFLTSANVLLTLDLMPKLSNYGLRRTIVDVLSKERLKWVSPESYENNCFTAANDVWGFGLLLHELSTCTEPFAEMDGETVVQRICDRAKPLRLEMPKGLNPMLS